MSDLTSEAPEQLMSIEDVGAYLNVPPWTIRKWRTEGKGPRARKLGRHVRFRREDVDDWLDTQ